MTKRTEAQKRADAKYAEKIHTIRVKVHLDEKAAIDAHLEKTGENMTTFVKRAIKETMEKDNSLE